MYTILLALLLTTAPDEPNWKTLKPTRTTTHNVKGIIKDLETHLRPNHKNNYSGYEKMTWAHEATHGVNNDIRLFTYKYNAFYVGNDKYLLLKEPNITITQVAKTVPKALRTYNYDHYLVKQAQHWNDYPSYIAEEWTAFTNELVCASEYIDDYKNIRHTKTDSVRAFLQMATYSAFYVKAAYDSGYKDEELKKYYKWNLVRGMKLYKQLVKYHYFNYDDDQFLKIMSKNKEFRSILDEYYGKEFTNSLFGS